MLLEKTIKNYDEVLPVRHIYCKYVWHNHLPYPMTGEASLEM